MTAKHSAMDNVVNFYMDDSGTRHPDHDPGKRAAHAYDWFALGGVLVKGSDEPLAREMHNDFCRKWGITCPIHSVEGGSNIWLPKSKKGGRSRPTKSPGQRGPGQSLGMFEPAYSGGSLGRSQLCDAGNEKAPARRDRGLSQTVETITTYSG
jgi:hypothetical protein